MSKYDISELAWLGVNTYLGITEYMFTINKSADWQSYSNYRVVIMRLVFCTPNSTT